METIPVYWEPKIKTYGFNRVDNLSLLELVFDSKQIADLGIGVQKLGDLGIRLLLVLAQYLSDKELHIYIIFKRQWEKKIIANVSHAMGVDFDEAMHITSPVGLIYFQGPHFGERYGIAGSAFGALSRKSISILAAGCSASSIYLVLPEERLEESETLLAEAFESPS